MALDPNIALGFQPPQLQNPLASIAQVQALKNQQQQAQMGGLELQQKQTELQQQQSVMQAFRNSGGDMEKALQEISTTAPLQYITLRNQQINLQKAYDEHAKATREDAMYQNDMAGRDAQFVADQPPELRPYAYLTKRAGWIKTNPALEQQLPPTWDDSLLPTLKGIVARSQSLKDQAATQASQAAAAKSEAELPGTKATAAMTVNKLQMQQQAIDEFRKNPQAGNAIIDSVLPSTLDANANAGFKANYRNAMMTGGPDAAEKVVAAATAHGAEISKELNPKILAARLQQAVAQGTALAQALVPIKVGETIATEKAKASASPDAFASIIDPAARSKAMAMSDAASKEYQDKLGAADHLQTLVQQARAGNQGAGPLISIAQLRQEVNRVNRQELEAVRGAGTLMTRIDGVLSRNLQGKPPDSLLNDIESLSKTLAEASRRTVNSKYTDVNKRYGARLPLYDSDAGGGSGNGGTQTHGHYDPETGTIITH